MAIAGQGITIIGGGIGGLTLALALRAKGAEVRVLEQADAIREVGAGIQVSPNGFAVLNALGLGDAFAKISVTGQAVSLRDYKAGREVTRLDLTGLPDPQSYRFVHRADLIELLATSVREAGVTLRLLQKAETVVPGPRPRVELANGDHVEDDLIIGADGLHSVLRPVLNGVAAPFFTGQVAWRAVVPNLMGHPPEARVHMGPGRHVVSYPLRGGEAVNLVAVEERRDWQAEGWSHIGDPAQLRAAFADFGGMVPEMLHAADRPGVWGLFRHNVARHWFGENVALLGDAAHPTLPFMAQGAVMAMEDAWVLADRLDRAEDVAQGLADYQNTRRDRVVKVVETANGNAWKYHLSNPLMRSAAHLGLGMMGRLAPGKMLSQFDWIYKHDVTAAR
ncbi:FAD-dependent monooxygenase [Tropicibacter sp. R15_0]|uniref:FAD-dependent monooxygenase n=1 Tax=Tropicibacter sp. R15_0 TaxID=2821101 RepID=UPI001ADC5608|nr:FAD-dependent monooxygenase [Tropicibacter sp. R15_0]MBO9464500.1 FAD-dependent monooxygenase [Tropicibacter sp. R15_0]